MFKSKPIHSSAPLLWDILGGAALDCALQTCNNNTQKCEDDNSNATEFISASLVESVVMQKDLTHILKNNGYDDDCSLYDCNSGLISYTCARTCSQFAWTEALFDGSQGCALYPRLRLGGSASTCSDANPTFWHYPDKTKAPLLCASFVDDNIQANALFQIGCEMFPLSLLSNGQYLCDMPEYEKICPRSCCRYTGLTPCEELKQWKDIPAVKALCPKTLQLCNVAPISMCDIDPRTCPAACNRCPKSADDVCALKCNECTEKKCKTSVATMTVPINRYCTSPTLEPEFIDVSSLYDRGLGKILPQSQVRLGSVGSRGGFNV